MHHFITVKVRFYTLENTAREATLESRCQSANPAEVANFSTRLSLGAEIWRRLRSLART